MGGVEDDVESRSASGIDLARTKSHPSLLDSNDVMSGVRKKRLTLAVLCILGTELCERMAFVGAATNLPLYLKQYMGYTAATASQLLQVWKGTVYVLPLIGAYVADAHLGRYRTILVFSVAYLAGLAGLTGLNAAPETRPALGAAPRGGYKRARAALWASMYLVALGSGGIKPCVGSFGGDQFRDGSAAERRARSSFFMWFYFAINLGALIAALAVVPVQEAKGYALGFGIPAALYAVAVGMLIVGALARLYHYVPPEGSPLARIGRVLWRALIANRAAPLPADGAALYDPPLNRDASAKSGVSSSSGGSGGGGNRNGGNRNGGSRSGGGGDNRLAYRMAWTPRMRWLDRAALPHGAPGSRQPTLTEVEEAKALLALAPFLITAVLFKVGCDPISTLLPLTGDSLDRRFGRFGRVPAASMSFANQLGMLLSVLAYDLGAVPAARRRGRAFGAVPRVGFGIFVQLAALLAAGFIELARYRIVDSRGLVAKFAAAAAAAPPAAKARAARDAAGLFVPLSIWWHVVPHFLEGVSETFVNAAVVEIFFTQVSQGTRSLANGLLLLAVGVGSYLAFALNKAVAAATRGDPWLAQNPLKGHYERYFFLNAGVVLLSAVLWFGWVARCYRERPIGGGESLADEGLAAEAGGEALYGGGGRGGGAGSTGGDSVVGRERSTARMLSASARDSAAAGAAAVAAPAQGRPNARPGVVRFADQQ